ncbi:hypothetical protein ARMGADRAFT_1077649 [Armillaria gallica]|uniref:Uncharacterized protein n=1 Tax=Armillaria gallica TaxID=47427 RepID=A0A2H3DLQ6_ARMGA|nr:hypothetical protein ARMGADRAFT_1077649 [Armillaria gallica]
MELKPSNPSQDAKDIWINVLDLNLNATILQALLHGLYTGIVVVTLWTMYMFSSPKLLCNTFLLAVIVTLYPLSTISFGTNWTFERSAFIELGDKCYSVFAALMDRGPRWRGYIFASAIAGGISTLLVDLTIIWRCWTIWGRQWKVVFIPMFCVVAATGMKMMEILSIFGNLPHNISKQGYFSAEIDWSLIYVSLTLATTLVCTLLIMYRILRRAPGMNSSRKIIEMLIESSAMYSISLIIYLALLSKNLKAGYYADISAAYVKVISPTLLVGRVSAHANAVSRREKMVAMWENHPPLVGCFREEGTDNRYSPDDGDQALSESSNRKETV